MFEVTYKLSNSYRHKVYKTENGALKAIWRWLLKHEHESYRLAILYAPHQERREFSDPEQLPFEETDKSTGNFYSSTKWLAVRYAAFEKYGQRCACCGNTKENGARLQVDHIKPRSLHPELALDIDNLQILCELCNKGKSNLYDTRWR